MTYTLFGHDVVALTLGAAAGLACGFLNTMASSGSAVSLPVLMMIGLDPVTANATNRVPVLVGAISATTSFYRGGHLAWEIAWRVGLPVTAGALIGAALAEVVPGRYLAIVITAAVFAAFLPSRSSPSRATSTGRWVPSWPSAASRAASSARAGRRRPAAASGCSRSSSSCWPLSSGISSCTTSFRTT